MRRSSVLAVLTSLIVASSSLAAATAVPSTHRFGTRHYGTGDRGVFVDAAADLLAVRLPAPAPYAGPLDAAGVADVVGALLPKVAAADVTVLRTWRVTTHGTVAVALSRAVDRAALAALDALVRDAGGQLWPVLVRGPGVSPDLVDEPLGGLDRAPVRGRAFADDRLVVTAAAGRLDEVLETVLAKTGGVVLERSRYLRDTALVQVGAVVGHDAVDAAALLAGTGGVRAVEPNLYRELRVRQATPDPLLGQQWHLSRDEEPAASIPGAGEIFAPEAWAVTRGSPDVVAAVFDSGTDWQHPDLIDNVRQDLMFDAATGDGDPGPECGQSQDGAAEVPGCPRSAPYVESHGTSVSGAVAAKGGNGIGVSGVCPDCSLMPVRLLGETATPTFGNAQAFSRACDPLANGSGEGAWLINNSWGPGFSLYFPLSTAERDAFELCRTVGRRGKGTVILFATGNETSNVRKDAYAKHPSVIAVAASTNLDDWASYSNYGDEVDVAAPSLGGTVQQDNYGIVTTDVRGGTRGYSIDGTQADGSGMDVDYNPSFSGTSAACPVAAGVAGLVLSANPSLTAEQVRLVLTRTADKIEADKVDWLQLSGQDLRAIFAYDAEGHSIAFGYGRVNAADAVALAAGLQVDQPLGLQGAACVTDAECVAGDAAAGRCDPALGRCLLPCASQADCVDGAVCVDAFCELPVERPGDFLSPCDDAACEGCVSTLDSSFNPTSVCSKACTVDADCDPSCANDPANCQPDGFDCRPATDDPNGPKICAIGEPNAGGPADFGACFNGQIGTSVVVTTGEGRELCGDICFDDSPAGCAYGFHCAEVTCTCTRETQWGCFEFTCAEVQPGRGDFFFPVCVPDAGHGDVCATDADCQFGDYCADLDGGQGRCRIDDRAGCDICQPCTDSSECGGRGVCIGTNNGQNLGVCAVACDDFEACPGNSECREFTTRRGTTLACLGTAPAFDASVTALDLCVDFVCEVSCRDDVPCADGFVCSDGECVVAPPPEKADDDDVTITFGGGPSCSSGAGVAPGFAIALLALLRRRRRR